MKAIAAISSGALVALAAAGVRANEPEHQQGVNWFGEGLEGLRFYSKTFPPQLNTPLPGSKDLDPQRNPTTRLTITRECTAVGATSGVYIKAYRCEASATRPISGLAEATKAGVPVPLVLVKGYWESNTAYKDSPELFSASCSIEDKKSEKGKKAWADQWTGSLAKCVELWNTNIGDGNLLTACIHMARAAYDGKDSNTYPGTWVDAYDVAGTHQHAPGCPRPQIKRGERNPDDICEMWVEATWDQKGAVCISHRRYESFQALPGVRHPFDSKQIDAPPDAGTADPIMHCREDANIQKKVGSGLAVEPAIIT